MDAHVAVAEIGLLLYPGAQMAAVHGLTDLFAVANRMAAEQPQAQLAALRVSHWSVTPPGTTLERTFDTQPDASSQPIMILIPPSLGEAPSAQSLVSTTQWIREQHAAGAAIGSVCLGAFLLAETGLLDSRSVTTHWTQAEQLAARFPRIKVEADKPMIDDGDILTSAGLMAWAELGLRVVERLHGPGIATRTARFLVIEHRDSSECGANFAPILGHGDEAILKLQHWLQTVGAVDVSIGTMAAQAGLEERTLLRRFRAATGLKPTEYCQHLRVGKARQMLEFTQRSVESIAWSVGYQDPSSFRSTFKKITGFSPSDYRGRFGANNASAAARHYRQGAGA